MSNQDKNTINNAKKQGRDIQNQGVKERDMEDQDLQAIEGFEELSAEYQAAADEMPPVHLDKQIIAAAHREIAHPNPRKPYKVSWWRRLSLPLYAAATVTFATIGTRWYWDNAPTRMPMKEESAPTTFDVSVQSTPKEKVKKSVVKPLPQPTAIMAPPQHTSNVSGKASEYQQRSLDANIEQQEVMNDLLSQEVDKKSIQQETEETVSVNAIGSRKADLDKQKHPDKQEYPDQDKWADEIVELFKTCDYQRAEAELKRFKQVYPDYPIDKKIDLFLQ